MSGFVQQHHTVDAFVSSDSWVILSEIEQSIKHKIERVGTPLKDWNIQIYRGVLTGYNNAFIITSEKRNEILKNCLSEEEKNRTAELIRPILRGRDIRRYGYDWAELYLIAMFPSKNYNIDNYPAVKDYLLSFGIERLEQTGKTHVINGNKIKSRKKTSNKWFEVQDSINYWDDFNKPKIIWKRIGSKIRFSYDDKGLMGLDSTCFAIGDSIAYLCCLLNSNMGLYLLKDSPKTGTGDLLISVQAVEPVHAPSPSKEIEQQLGILLEGLINGNKKNEEVINKIIYDLFHLTPDEIDYITSYITQFQ